MKYSVVHKDIEKISKFIEFLQIISKFISVITVLFGCYLCLKFMIVPGIGLILSGSTLWLWHQEKIKGKLAVFAISCLSLLISLEILEIFPFFFRVDLGKIPGTLAANTAIAFISLGIALLLLTKNFYSGSQFCSVLAFLIALIGFLGDAYQIKQFYGFGSYTTMFLPISMAIILLSIGVLFASPDRGWMKILTSENAGGIMARRMSPIAIAMPLIIGWLILIGYRNNNYSPEIAITLLSVLNLIFFNWVIWCTARFLTRVDSQRKQVQKALQENEIKFRAIFDQSFQLMALLQPNGTLIEANQAALNFAEIPLFDVIDKPFWQTRWWVDEDKLITRLSLNSKEDLSPIQEQLKNAIHQASQGELVRYEVDIRGANNQVATIDFSLKPLRDRTGEVILLIAEGRDISDRKQVEIALREREQFLASIYDGVNYIICVVDVKENGEITYAGWNPATEKITGISSQTSFGKTPEELFPPHLANEFRQGFNQCLAAQASISYESSTKVDDKEVWLMATLTPLKDPTGKIYRMIATSTYITERKKAEEALRESEKLVRLFVEHTPAAIAMFDKNMNYLITSRSWLIDYHLEQQNIIGKSHYEVFPNVPDRWREIYHRCLNGAIEKCEEDQIIHADGTIDWIYWQIHPWHNDNNEIGGIIIFSELITARKEAEIALQQSEAQFRKLAQQETLVNRIANQIRNSLDIDQILTTTVNEVRNLLQIDRAAFGWYNYDANPETWECIKEAKNDLLRSILGLYKATVLGPLKDKILNQETFQVDEVSTFPDPVLRQFLVDLRYTSILILPIKTQSGKVGAFSFGHTRSKRPFNESEVELIEAVGVQLAIALNQAELYAQSQERTQQLEITLQELQQTQTQLIQSEKMSSLGQMVAGVAHEINNPVSFIYGNIQPATEYIRDLLKLLKLYQLHYPIPVQEIQTEIEEIDLEFLVEDLPKLLASIKVGASRIRDIVKSLRLFSRLDEADMKVIDIHEGIDSTIMILEHRLKPRPHFSGISVIKKYHKLPLVECYAGQLNQVFMNILTNAIDVLENQSEPRNITITTQVKNQLIIISIADNGSGMTKDIKSKIFDPFFTTKDIGKGTGLGLSISHSIIVEKHNGNLRCNSELGQGTEFIIEIPIRQK
ncbi:PAS domain S-box protein [[Phormidium ambiguum] IAM M-71]|uniref:PAS domain S-box protein n=1 Tax=[Phormidium ambiguum] IAM M-71 TaxID=454136 RepID=UPI000A00D019|nr:PAS domain S-box protein [Phormidium ambiguum]